MLRFRYSLRTLLLAVLFAGSAMLLWQVRGAWLFRTWPLYDAPNAERVPLQGPVHPRFSPSGDYALMLPRGLSFGEKGETCLLNLRSGSIQRCFPEGMHFEWHASRDKL